MKIKLLISVVFALALIGCQDDKPTQQTQDTSDNATADNSISHSLGLLMGSQIKSSFDDVSIDEYLQGFKQGYQTEVPRETLTAANQKLQEYHRERRQKLAEEQKAKSEKAVATGNAYLEQNAKREGVKSTESGLQYEVLSQGSGDSPNSSDRVTVHYKGTLIDGTEFDSSYSRGDPATFSLGGVIKGWTEGLQLMNKGAKFKFVIPPGLAYGERGSGPKIGPNETLIFEVELIDINKQDEKANTDRSAPNKPYQHRPYHGSHDNHNHDDKAKEKKD